MSLEVPIKAAQRKITLVQAWVNYGPGAIHGLLSFFVWPIELEEIKLIVS